MFKSLKAKMLTVLIGFLTITFFLFYIFLYQEISEALTTKGLDSAQKMLSFAMYSLESKCKGLEHYEDIWMQQRKSMVRNIIKIQKLNIINELQIIKNIDRTIDESRYSQLAHVQKFRFDQNNFIWVCDSQAKWLAHPNPSFINQSFMDKVDPNGKPILKSIIKDALASGSGFYSYIGRRPGDQEYQETYCYFEYISELDWIIGSNFYRDEITQELENRKNAMLEEIRTMFNNINIGNSGYLLLFDHHGKVLSHPYLPVDTELSGIVNKATGNMLLNELIEISKTPEKPLLYLWDKVTERGKYKYWKYAYTHHYENFNWYLVATFYKDEIHQLSDVFLRKFVTLSIFFIVLFIVVFILSVNAISTPILRLASCIHEMGNNNLYAILPDKDLQRTDELGIIARGYEATRSYLSEIIAEMNKHAKTVAGASENFSKGAKKQLELSEKMNEQAKIAVQSSNNNLKHIQLITNETELGARDINTILERINQLSENINSVAESAAQSSSHMTAISTLIIEVSEDIYQVNESVEHMAEDLTLVFNNSSDNVTISRNAEKQIASSLEAMNKLQEASENINNAVQSISAISSQTNLLALNATIEAVHAGEAGEGFAVVAEEVKVLAAKTNSANDQIRNLIVKIREYMESTIQSIHETNNAIKSVVDNNVSIGQAIARQRDISQNLSKVIESISQGANKSAKKAKESDMRLKDVTFFSAEVAELAKVSADNVAQTAGRIKDIAESSDVVLSGIQKANGNIITINEYSGNITQVAKNNHRNAQELLKMTEALDNMVTIFNACNISKTNQVTKT